MTQLNNTVETKVVLGNTHFTIPGYDEVVAFSPEAIANDQRWPEILKAMNDKLRAQAGNGQFEEVILGKTHFHFPGEYELFAFSAEAIEKDQRHAEMIRVMGEEMLKRANATTD